MRTALIANGVIDNPKQLLSTLSQFDQIIAVDGGYHYCRQLGIKPHLLIGDLDSIDDPLVDIQKITFPRDKDKTDLEIAIEYAHAESTELVVFGAMGGRTDHTLYNLEILARYPGKLLFETEIEKICALQHKTSFKTKPGQTLSLLPINGPVTGINTKGLRWELVNATFDGHFMSVCNETVANEVSISFDKGNLLMVASR